MREVEHEGRRVSLDLSTQVVSLSIGPSWRGGEPELSPTPPKPSGFIGAALLARKAKQFDDRLYAAVELATQPAKAALLRRLLFHDLTAAAAELGGLKVDLSPGARALQQEFLENPLRSKPLGFYTGSESLSRIFRQDRMLQGELERAEPILEELRKDPAPYVAMLHLAERLTNPFPKEKTDLRPYLAGGSPPKHGLHFLPPSRSHEGEIIKELFSDRPIPDGFDLAEELIRRIRRGELNLAPKPDSGWYDWQTWSLEPLAALDRMPEGPRLHLSDEYRTKLAELFRAVLALTRETHVKQLEIATGAMCAPPGEMPVSVAPELTVEPLPTYYERRAAGYRFVEGVVANTGVGLDELRSMIGLFESAAAASRRELGLGEKGELRGWTFDAGDARMMVPVFHDLKRRMTKVWAFLGWYEVPLEIGFHKPPKIVSVHPKGTRVEFDSTSRALPVPVCVETYVAKLLDRDEFRAHCDRWKKRAAILEHLE